MDLYPTNLQNSVTDLNILSSESLRLFYVQNHAILDLW